MDFGMEGGDGFFAVLTTPHRYHERSRVQA